MTPLVLDEIDQPEMWELIAWLTERSTDWVLIGGLMVASFDVEYGHAWRPTEDIDSLFGTRHTPRGAIRSHVAEGSVTALRRMRRRPEIEVSHRWLCAFVFHPPISGIATPRATSPPPS